MIRTLLALVLTTGAAVADDAQIVSAEARANGETWTVSVTLLHGDTGWDDYANGWRVVTAEGEVLGVRELLHPHQNEQPFTRSLPGVVLPEEDVFIEARTSVDGWGGERLRLVRD